MTGPDRLSLRARKSGQGRAVAWSWRWMYLLCLVPMLTDVVETGGWPHTLRARFTEAAIGVLILLLVRHLAGQQRQVFALAWTDALTGLWNRAGFDESVEDECARAHRSNQPLALVYMDLDHFKTVNDTQGHAAGDEVLRQLGDAMRQAVRNRIDRGFRLGGDEFALLLPGSTAAHAQAVIARVRRRCEAKDAVWRQGLLGISAGIVEWQPHESGAELVRRADAAMFDAKRARHEDSALASLHDRLR